LVAPGSRAASLPPYRIDWAQDIWLEYDHPVKKPDRPPSKSAGAKREAVRSAPKSAVDLAMERLRALDRKAGVEKAALSPAQKEKIGEARRIATSRFAEREILFREAMQRTEDPAAREKAEREYQLDRQRITDGCERAIEAIRRQTG
jgi:hypothetical protein